MRTLMPQTGSIAVPGVAAEACVPWSCAPPQQDAATACAAAIVMGLAGAVVGA